MGEIAVIIVNLEKVGAILFWPYCAQGTGQCLGVWKSVARVGSDLVFGS